MSETRDRTKLIVSVIVVAGVIGSLVCGCFGGGLAGYLLASQQTRRLEKRLDALPNQGIPELEELREVLPQLPELLDRLRGLERFEEFEFPYLPEFPEIPEFDEEHPFFEMPGDLQMTGAWIREVIEGTPAEEAGLMADDLIVAVDSVPIDQHHPLEQVISGYKPGDQVAIDYLREGEKASVEVRLTEHPDDPERPYLGVHFIAISMQQRFERRIDPNRQPSG